MLALFSARTMNYDRLVTFLFISQVRQNKSRFFFFLISLLQRMLFIFKRLLCYYINVVVS